MTGGTGGVGGSGSAGGSDLCAAVVCPNKECRLRGACNPSDGTCNYANVAQDGTACSEGECLAGGCGRLGAFACTEEGIRAAIAQGGGPHFFACDEAVPVALVERIVIDNDVILDGEGELVLDASETLGAFWVESERDVELRSIHAIGAWPYNPSIYSAGNLTLIDSSAEGVESRGTLTVIDTEVSRFGVVNDRGVATLTRTRISAPESNDAIRGGGISNYGGTMTVTDSTISGSGSELSVVGGVYNTTTFILIEGETVTHEGILLIENTTISGNTGRYAGGIENNGGTLMLMNSTVSGNTAECGPSIRTWTYPGATMTVHNSTVSGGATSYECGSNFNGYGIGNDGTLVMSNSTVAANALGGLDNRGEVTVTNSVVDGGCVQLGDNAVTASVGYNIVGGSDTCGFNDPTDQIDVTSSALALGPLTDNGGQTMTHALLPGSVAIDVIPAPMCEVTEDQRGEPRPAGGMCDVGAFEVQP
jgi:hypothetical protein